MRTHIATILFLSTILLAACTDSPTTAPQETLVAVVSTEAPTPAATASHSPAETLTVWVAPAFAPNTSTPAGTLLAERLTAFEQDHPGISIIVRLKEEDGPGGLLESLSAASIAAPSTLPDLISLDPASLNTAALNELIQPLDEWLKEPEAPEWYDYAISTASIGGGFFGLPFASDTEVLAYRALLYPVPPMTWTDILDGPAPFLFPASDPLAAFTLTQYLALGGPSSDETGRITLDPEILTDVLDFYNAAHISNILPASSRQYSTSAATWAVLKAEKAASAVVSFSLFLKESNVQIMSAVPLPTRSEPGICLAEAWSWAIVSRDPAKQELSAQLLDWLIQPEFLGPWTHALKMLPPTATALVVWPDGPDTALANSLVTIIRPGPSNEERIVLGPLLRTAIEAILSEGASPEDAAQAALQSLMNWEPD